MSYKPLEYWNGFRTADEKVHTGISALFFYSIGYINYHIHKMIKEGAK